MADKMKILFYTCVWGRPLITRLCFDGIKRVINECPDFIMSAHVCVSEKWAADLALEYGFTVSWSENKPVGRKHNKGVADILDLEWDYLLQVGSDDVLDARLLDIYGPWLDKRLDVLGVCNAYLTDGRTCKRVGRAPNMVGAGRMISKRAIKRAGWRDEIVFEKPGHPMDGHVSFVNASEWRDLAERNECRKTGERKFMLWDDGLDCGLDRNSWERLFFAQSRNKSFELRPEEAYVVDLKGGGEQINGFEEMECLGDAVPLEDIELAEVVEFCGMVGVGDSRLRGNDVDERVDKDKRILI